MGLRSLLLAAAAVAAGAEADATCSDGPYTIDDVNSLVVKAEYAVRGRLLERATQLEAALARGEALPFSRIVKCNIGNPQALGQKPLSYVRQTLSLMLNPELLSKKLVRWTYPKDVVARAEAFVKAMPSVGAYSDSQGIALVREHVAEFIADRDGHAASAADVYLTDGASAGVKALLALLVRGPHDAVMVPVPQYPLYSAATAMLNGTLAPYYLDESAAWGVSLAELERSYAAAKDAGAAPRIIAVINPGNPTGQSLPAAAVEMILRFAAKRRLVVMADEVYQENVYGDAPPFVSFKKALVELRLKGATEPAAAKAAAAVQLVSFHSTSKGFIGECGLRGGYFELQNLGADLRAQITKLASVSLCSNVVGQLATGLMVRPPKAGEPSYKLFSSQRAAILGSMAERATYIARALNALPGIACNAAEGAMYLFPRVALPPKAIAAAAAVGYAADEFYCLKLLEATGLVVVPGSGFGQKEGTWHFRTTFLPPKEMLVDVLAKFGTFHTGFMAEYSAGK